MQMLFTLLPPFMKVPLLLLVFAALAAAQLRADDEKPDAMLPAANAMNALGINLLAKTPRDKNALLSPYSIESALAMTCAGAEGKTRDEMAAVLHFPKDASALNASFAQLRRELEQMQKGVAAGLSDGDESATKPKEDPALVLSVSNRLFGQANYAFREPFLAIAKDNYNAPLQELDFEQTPGNAVKTINGWVSAQTHGRIKDLVPENTITKATRLVLVNAIYFKG